MSFIVGNEMVFIPLVGIAVFISAYFSADRVIEFLHKQSLGSREEVLRLMDQMFIDTDRKRVTWLMLGGSFGLGLLAFLAVWPHFELGIFLGGALCYLGFVAPKVIMTNLFERRCTRLTDQMVDGMTIMANGIQGRTKFDPVHGARGGEHKRPACRRNSALF